MKPALAPKPKQKVVATSIVSNDSPLDISTHQLVEAEAKSDSETEIMPVDSNELMNETASILEKPIKKFQEKKQDKIKTTQSIEKSDKTVCRFFQYDKCLMGSKCSYQHICVTCHQLGDLEPHPSSQCLKPQLLDIPYVNIPTAENSSGHPQQISEEPLIQQAYTLLEKLGIHSKYQSNLYTSKSSLESAALPLPPSAEESLESNTMHFLELTLKPENQPYFKEMLANLNLGDNEVVSSLNNQNEELLLNCAAACNSVGICLIQANELNQALWFFNLALCCAVKAANSYSIYIVKYNLLRLGALILARDNTPNLSARSTVYETMGMACEDLKTLCLYLKSSTERGPELSANEMRYFYYFKTILNPHILPQLKATFLKAMIQIRLNDNYPKKTDIAEEITALFIGQSRKAMQRRKKAIEKVLREQDENNLSESASASAAGISADAGSQRSVKKSEHLHSTELLDTMQGIAPNTDLTIKRLEKPTNPCLCAMCHQKPRHIKHQRPLPFCSKVCENLYSSVVYPMCLECGINKRNQIIGPVPKTDNFCSAICAKNFRSNMTPIDSCANAADSDSSAAASAASAKLLDTPQVVSPIPVKSLVTINDMPSQGLIFLGDLTNVPMETLSSLIHAAGNRLRRLGSVINYQVLAMIDPTQYNSNYITELRLQDVIIVETNSNSPVFIENHLKFKSMTEAEKQQWSSNLPPELVAYSKYLNPHNNERILFLDSETRIATIKNTLAHCADDAYCSNNVWFAFNDCGQYVSLNSKYFNNQSMSYHLLLKPEFKRKHLLDIYLNIKRGGLLTPEVNTDLNLAICFGELEIVKQLIENKKSKPSPQLSSRAQYELNFPAITPLELACIFKKKDVAQYLLQHTEEKLTPYLKLLLDSIDSSTTYCFFDWLNIHTAQHEVAKFISSVNRFAKNLGFQGIYNENMTRNVRCVPIAFLDTRYEMGVTRELKNNNIAIQSIDRSKLKATYILMETVMKQINPGDSVLLISGNKDFSARVVSLVKKGCSVGVIYNQQAQITIKTNPHFLGTIDYKDLLLGLPSLNDSRVNAELESEMSAAASPGYASAATASAGPGTGAGSSTTTTSSIRNMEIKHQPTARSWSLNPTVTPATTSRPISAASQPFQSQQMPVSANEFVPNSLNRPGSLPSPQWASSNGLYSQSNASSWSRPAPIAFSPYQSVNQMEFNPYTMNYIDYPGQARPLPLHPHVAQQNQHVFFPPAPYPNLAERNIAWPSPKS